MIGWLGSALAAPVLVDESPEDRLARCVAEAEAEAADVGWRPGAAERSDRVAVVVGVPCHESATIPPLSYSTRDAFRVAARLAEGGFTIVPLTTLVTRAELDEALDRAEALLEPGGTLLVYFSGHGVLREEEGRIRRYLVLSDTDLAALLTTAMPVPALEARVASIAAGRRIVVQDTCFAAQPGGKSIGADPGQAKGLALPEPGGRLAPGDAQLYASRFYEQAIESPRVRGSVYTWHLLDGLGRGDADLDGDGCVGLVEAHEWAARRTEEERHGFQVPQLRGEAPDNVLLGCAPREAIRAVVGAPAGDSWLVRVTRDGALVSEGTGALEPGRYRVGIDHLEETATDVVTRRLLAGSLRVRAGEWLDLRAELERRAPFGVLEAVGALRATDEVPDLAGGLGLWWAARDRGAGRLAVGLVGRGTSGSAWVSGEVLGRIGWWWTFRRARIDLGPVLAVGPVERAARSPAGVLQAFHVGTLIVPAVRGQLVRGRMVIAAELGLNVLPIRRDPSAVGGGDWVLDTAPSVGIAVGSRL